MAIRVTRPITKYGRYYAAGEILDEPLTSVERSLKNLLQWEKVDDPEPAIGGLRKPQLVGIAVERGVDVEGLTKAEIIELLEG